MHHHRCRRTDSGGAAHTTLIVALAALTLVLTGCGSTESTPDAATPSAAAAVDTTSPPGNLTWQRFQGVPVPISDAGPNSAYSAAATGYARTPQGAAVAAINTVVRMSVATDAQWPQIASASVAPGTGRDTWMVNRAQLSITAPLPAADAPTPRGYLVDHYTPASADLTLVTEQSDRSLTSQPAHMVFTGGDWRLDLSSPSPVSAIDSPPVAMVAFAHAQ